MAKGPIRIGGATAAITDSAFGVAQFARMSPPLDYIVFDTLSESVLGRLALQRREDPSAGHVRHFVPRLLGEHLRPILAAGTRIVTNAGGLNPRACAGELRTAAARFGLSPRIAVVEGDDIADRLVALLAEGREMFSGEPLGSLPAGADAVLSFTAYLGALPIRAALDAGADIVVTGRTVDSATTLGALMHEYGWGADDFDLLAAGTLAGHVIECGTQATGGTFTDWRDVPDWANIGYPIAECHADGSVVVTKPEGTGGLVSVGTVAEQILYEVQDVGAYVVPDVVCDFRGVRAGQVGPDRVRLSGARGRSRTATYKACMTFQRGWRGVYAIPIVGQEAADKAQVLGEALVARARGLLRAAGLADFTAVRIEAIGGESAYGERAAATAGGTREVVARFLVEHDARAGVDLFMDEAATSLMLVAGATMPLTQSVAPVQHLRSLLVDKAAVPVRVVVDGAERTLPIPTTGGFDPLDDRDATPPLPGGGAALTDIVPLVALAWVRSGDKGDLFNLGVIAREADYLPFIAAALDPAAVTRWYAQALGALPAPSGRQFAPGLGAFNFVIEGAMGGGLAANPRFDSCGKGNGQQILDFPVPVTRDIARRAATARPTRGASQGE